MIRKKVKKKVVKKEEKKQKKQLTEREVKEKKYKDLIDEIRPNLLTKGQLKRGGPNIRAQYSRERGYQKVLNEINALGKELGYPPVGLGHLRR